MNIGQKASASYVLHNLLHIVHGSEEASLEKYVGSIGFQYGSDDDGNQCALAWIGHPMTLPDVINQKVRRTISLEPYDPSTKHLCVSYGINFLAKCSNSACSVNGKFVWIQKGFGTFHLVELKYKLACPICLKNVKSTSLCNMGFTLAKIVYEGVKIIGQEEQSVQKFEDIEKDGKFVTYVNNTETNVEWGYLNITVSNL